MRTKVNLGILLATIGSVSYLSLGDVAGSGVVPAGGYLSLVGHFFMYFFLAGAFLLYFHDFEHDHVEAVIAAGLVGIILEAIQHPLPHRTSFQTLDVLVNFAGASVILVERRIPVIHRVIEFEEKLLSRL